MTLPQYYHTPFALGGDTPTRDRARVVANNLPKWLLDAPAAVRTALVASQASSQAARKALADWLAPLPKLDEFAEQQLKAALQPTLGEVDVRNHVLAWHKDVGSLSVPRKHMSQQTLLHAALQNFVADEVFGRESSLLPAGSVTIEEGGLKFRYNPNRALAMTPTGFAAACRTLDIGGQYQLQLKQRFDPADDKARVTALFTDNDRYSFEVQAHIAQLRGHISEAAYQALLGIAKGDAAIWGAKAVRVAALRMMQSSAFEGGDLHGPLLVDTADGGPCVLYLPLEADTPFKEYKSLQAAHDALREKLRSEAYRRYWQRFVSQREAASFADHLKDRLTPLVTIFPATPRREPAPDANLNFERVELTGPLFAAVHARRVARVLDDGKVLAMPTANIDQQQRDERNRGWLAAGLELLGVVALFIPGIGELMLFCAAVQVVAEIYTGVQDWRHGDADAAVSHALGVAENVALLATLYGAGKLVAPPKTPAWPKGDALDELVPVRLPDGRAKLLRPTLSGYETTVALPKGAPLNDELLLEHEDQEYAPIGSKYYAVRRDYDVESEAQVWRATHPTDTNAYEPLVEFDGTQWRLKPDQSVMLRGRTLRAMLDAPLERLDATDVELALRCVGVDAALLDETFHRDSKASALLADTLLRFDIAEAIAQHRANIEIKHSSLKYKMAETFKAQAQVDDDTALFQALYTDSHFGNGAELKVLIRDFPSIPTTVAEEILGKCGPQAKLAIVQDKRLPLGVAEEAREYVRALRLNRALEGLCRAELKNADSELLETEWQARLTGQATPGQIREAALTDRAQCSQWLNQQPTGRFFSAPVRDEMGRLGYALSGRRPGSYSRPLNRHQIVARVKKLFPLLTREQALDYWGSLQLPGHSQADVVAVLEDLLQLYNELDLHLAFWVESEPSAQALQRFDGSLEELQHQRRDVRSLLMNAWGRAGPETLISEGEGQSLTLEGRTLMDLPGLAHRFNFIHELNLSTCHVSAQDLAHLLPCFGRLRKLSLHATGLEALPELSHLRSTLRALDLGGNHLLVDQAMFDQLGSLTRLQRLSLNGNSVLGVNQANGFAALQSIDLGNTAIGQWPEWLGSLVNLREAELRNAGLTSIPASVLDEDGMQMISVRVRDNALSRETQARLATPPRPLRRFNIFFPLPDDEASVSAMASPWLVGLNTEKRIAQMATWTKLHSQPASSHFLWVINELRKSMAFTLDRPGLSRRVLDLVSAADRQAYLRARLFDIASRGRFLDDDVLVTFSDLEMAVYSYSPTEPRVNASTEKLLEARLRAMFRVEQIRLRGHDFISGPLRLPNGIQRQGTINLQLRWTLGERLSLPARPLRPPVPGTQLLSAAQVDAVEAAVREAEAGEALVNYLVGNEAWRGLLRRAYNEEIINTLAEVEQAGNWAQWGAILKRKHQQMTRRWLGRSEVTA